MLLGKFFLELLVRLCLYYFAYLIVFSALAVVVLLWANWLVFRAFLFFEM